MSVKTAIYARYSGDRQREASIDDQVRNCARFAEREQLQITETYFDKAMSGTVTSRPGYQSMIEDAKRGLFGALLVDDLSRLSRDDYEMKGLMRILGWNNIRIIGVCDGYDSSRKGHKIHAGFKGLMNELYIDDLRDKTHRGMTGQAIKGYNCGGRTFGYKNCQIEDAARKDAYGRPMVIAVQYQVHAEQAEIVRNIFQWYADGYSYRWIASELNRQAIASSRGKSWAISAIKVILENEMYAGKLIWNRRQWSKHPETGRRTYKERPQSEWIVTKNLALEIIDQKLFNAVRKRQNRNREQYSCAKPLNQRYLFSGILMCATCGGPFTIVAHNRYGCATHKTRGPSICDSSMSVSRLIVEDRLLDGIRSKLLTTLNIEKFKKEAVKLIENQRQSNQLENLSQRLKETSKEHTNILNAIRAGIVTPSTKQALEAAEGDMADLETKIDAIKSVNLSSILPRAVERYQSAVESLSREFSGHVGQARDLIKFLVGDQIRVHRRDGYLEAELQNNMTAVFSKAIGSDLHGCGSPQYTESDFISLKPYPDRVRP